VQYVHPPMPRPALDDFAGYLKWRRTPLPPKRATGVMVLAIKRTGCLGFARRCYPGILRRSAGSRGRCPLSTLPGGGRPPLTRAPNWRTARRR
jgi:hypothetical protein